MWIPKLRDKETARTLVTPKIDPTVSLLRSSRSIEEPDMERELCLGLWNNGNKLLGEHGRGNSWKSQGSQCREGDLGVAC